MTIKHLYPNARPSLDLKFAKDKVLDPRITYSRSSSGTYFDATGTLQSAATNEARFDHDPTTGESLGLLVEEARTNLAENSGDFNLWATINSTVLTAQGIAPDGTNTAFKIQEDTSVSISHGIEESSNSTWSGAATLSCYVKPSGRNFARLGLGVSQTSITFDLVNKVSSYKGTNVTSGSVEDAGNGWLRIVAVFSSSITSGKATVGPAESDSVSGLNYTGDGTSGILAWGAQLEAGSFPTSYIPTPATFTSRSTTATYYDANGVIQTAGIDVARDDAYFPDENGVMKPAGLLLEAAGTNLALNSGTLSSWSLFGAPIRTLNATTAPDGTTTATRFQKSRIAKETIYTGVGTGVQSRSFFAKAGTSSFVFVEEGAPYVWFDLSNGTVNPSGRGSMVALPNGWYRCIVSKSWGSNNFVLGISDASNSTDAAIGNYAYFWGAQAEASSYPTSYIPTSGSTVTRAADVSSSSTVTRSADVAQITGGNFSSWWNQAEGTAFVNYKTSSREQFNSPFSFRISAASNVQSWGHWTYNGGSQSRVPIYGQRPSPNEPQELIGTFNSIDLNRYYKVAISQDGSDMSGCIETDTTRTRSMTALPAMSVLTIGWVGSTSQRMTGHIARLTYYPVRLPDATLQTLTS